MSPVLLPLLSAFTIAAADTTTYVVLNHGRIAGDMVIVRDGESVTVRYQYVDRNRGQRIESRYRIASSAIVQWGEARPIGTGGQAEEPTERFEITDSVRWSGRAGSNPGATRLEPGAFYRLRTSNTPFDAALLARYLLGQPQRTAKLMPTGSARAEVVADTTVMTKRGRQRVKLVMIHGLFGATPGGVWLDDKGALFASDVGWFITVRPGAESTLPALRAIEVAYRDAKGAELARRLTTPATGPVVIKNGDLFDSERGVVRPKSTVVIRGDRIVAVGPADSVAVPAGATVIDATGKTIVPGLWDMHGHFQLTSQTGGAVSQLGFGITSVRDLAADIDVAVSHRDRAQSGTILAPHSVLAGFIEGPGRWAGPSDAIARNEDEARAWVARYDSLGYKQIKLYNLMHPDFVPTIAEEAHKRGMRLSGHIPRGLSLPAAIQLGFDEVNHAAFLFSTFYQDSLYLPRMRPYSAVATAVAPNINVDGAEMTALIELLRSKGTVVDGTFNLWVRAGGVPGSGETSDIEAANRNYLRLIKRLYDAGVTLVPGTDNSSGTTYHTELEIYERAGIPAPNVLQMATIVSARVMKDDRDYGSIATGKVADIVIIDGRPAERISDLRRVDRVIRAGRVYDPKQLFAAVNAR